MNNKYQTIPDNNNNMNNNTTISDNNSLDDNKNIKIKTFLTWNRVFYMDKNQMIGRNFSQEVQI